MIRFKAYLDLIQKAPSSARLLLEGLTHYGRDGARVVSFWSDLNRVFADELMAYIALAAGPDAFEKDIRRRVLDQTRWASKLTRRWYGVYRAFLHDLIAESRLVDEKNKKVIAFLAHQHLNALAPSNYFWTNPSAVKRFIDTRGASLGISLGNWLRDIARNDLSIQACNLDAFQVGRNLATTPGAVVFRNELMELIQYPAAGPGSFAQPIVIIHPWINRYYIFDLDEQKSLVRFLTMAGFTTFITSWKNPGREMRNLSFEDYVIRGALQAVEVARDICGCSAVHAAGYCLGGVTLAALMALLNKTAPRDVPVANWSLFATAIDFAQSGSLAVLINKSTVRLAEALMRRDGYLDGKYIGAAFNFLRSDSQVWWRYSRNYLQGIAPALSEHQFWNHDKTRIPEALGSFCLRELCLGNKLMQPNGLTLAGRRIDLGRIRQPLYAVGAFEDHICRWKSTFSACREFNGPLRYVLSSGGHITGIVNPPTATRSGWYRAENIACAHDSENWLRRTAETRGSWWHDWLEWLSDQNPARVDAHPLGSRKFPAMDKAPGVYVTEK
jgi:polyhydroxyalkanoate synthase